MGASTNMIETELLRMFVDARQRNAPLMIFMLLSISVVVGYLQTPLATVIWASIGLAVTGLGYVLYSRFRLQSLTQDTARRWLYIILCHRVLVGMVLCSLVWWAWNPDLPQGNLILILLIATQIPLYAMTGGVVLPIFYSEQIFSFISVSYGSYLLSAQWGHPEIMLPVGYYLLASMVFPIRINRSMREMLQLQYDLLRSSEAAEAASKAKSSFLSTMSHEIRTPLNSIIGMNELLLESSLTAEQNKYALAAKNAGTHLLHLINDILDYSKLEAGRIELEMVDFDLRQEIESAFSMMSVNVNNKAVNLVYEIDAEVPAWLQGDLSRLRQIIFNLLGNAIKFTDNGSIRLIISKVPDQSDVAAGTVRLRADIIDTGIGIAPDKITHLFKDFTQADTSMTRLYGGTGLGLAISKRLVELMFGEIGVESVPGKGSRFWFTMPMKISARAGKTEILLKAPPSENMSMLRVLVAEDNPSNQLLISILLEKLNCICKIVNNGQEALDALTAGPGEYDVILMDMQMPVLDGISATVAIRALTGQAGKLPVIALTADAMNGVREQALAAGMNDYLSKPIDVRALGAALAHWGNVSREENLYAAGSFEENSAPAAEILIDEAMLQSMAQVLGEQKTAELLNEFWPTVDEKLVEIRAALSALDSVRVHALAHELKGSAGNFGGLQISRIAALLEKDASDPVRAARHIQSIATAAPETHRQAIRLFSSGKAA